MPYVSTFIKALTVESYAIANAGSRYLMVHTMICGGYQLDNCPALKKARKGWIICANMEIRLMPSRLRTFSQHLHDATENLENRVLWLVYSLVIYHQNQY